MAADGAKAAMRSDVACTKDTGVSCLQVHEQPESAMLRSSVECVCWLLLMPVLRQ